MDVNQNMNGFAVHIGTPTAPTNVNPTAGNNATGGIITTITIPTNG